MYSASITVGLSSEARFANPQEFYFGKASCTNLTNYLGSKQISLPSSMHSGDDEKTYILVTQKDTSEQTRGKFSYNYSVAADCTTATIYVRDVTETVSNGTSTDFSFLVIQDRS